MKLSLKYPAWLSEIESLTEISELPLEIIEGVADLVKSPEKFIAFKFDDNAASVASESVVRLDPTDRLGVLMAALRTWNLNRFIVEHSPSIPKRTDLT